ncbi:MAG TPA: alpha/beta hydrolase [Mycobacteriales bacterium]|nr:alpha/beta hydrolase [Mycobacteriales bacterium]
MITLRDGRNVQVQEYGDPAGSPALWFHGAMSSRLEGGFFDAAAHELGVRLVALDRPGVGGSDPLAGRSATDYALDATDVLDALGIDRAAVGGQSNGGMYAMAVASQIPDRVVRAVPYNPTTPVADRAAKAALSRGARMSYSVMARKPEMVTKQAVRSSTPGRLAAALARRTNPDMRLLDDPATAAAWAANTGEVLKQLDSGYLAGEIDLAVGRWGFDHRAVQVPVVLVSGEKDGGLGYAKVWANELPDGRLVVVPHGHIGMLDPAVAHRIVELLAGRP